MAAKRSGKAGNPRPAKKVLAQPARHLAGATSGAIVKQSVSQVADAAPGGYKAFLADLKLRIQRAQVRAALSVNRELIELYWSIGRDIVARQRLENWGSNVIDRLSADIRRAFPGIGGFSSSNISRMRAFYFAWTPADEISAQPVPKMKLANSAQPVPKMKLANSAQPVPKMKLANSAQPVPKSFPNVIAEIPWGHNVVLLFQVQNPAERLWYAQQTIANGWSRSMLIHWIESGLYSRQGKSINNFNTTLPATQSDLARELIKDSYTFDFLTLATDAAERDLERGLLAHIRKFLIELGAGFAFVGQQVPLEVDGEDFSIDLLFYHLRLRCYIVIDLKVKAFKPEFAGKMNFYLSAVDDKMRHGDDEPSIGLILCKTRKKTVAEYALRDLKKPVGVARYVTRLMESLPKELAGALPSVEEVEAELEKGAGDGN